MLPGLFMYQLLWFPAFRIISTAASSPAAQAAVQIQMLELYPPMPPKSPPGKSPPPGKPPPENPPPGGSGLSVALPDLSGALLSAGCAAASVVSGSAEGSGDAVSVPAGAPEDASGLSDALAPLLPLLPPKSPAVFGIPEGI